MIGSYTHYLLVAQRWDAAYRATEPARDAAYRATEPAGDAVYHETEQAPRPAPHVGDVYPWIVYGRERSGRTLYGVMHAFDGRDTGAHWGIDDAYRLAGQIKADQSTFDRLTALMKPAAFPLEL